MEEKKYDLEERLINFGVAMIQNSRKIAQIFCRHHLSGQLIRSGTSPALNYGEAISAQSRNDFIHKMKVALKELRETNNCLRMIRQLKWLDNDNFSGLKECNELISIFVKSIATAQRNKQNMKGN
jgi:four helix bundle protein